MNRSVLSVLVTIVLLLGAFTPTLAQSELTSDNYKIIDPQVDSGGGVSNSASFGLLSSLGDPTADARLTSGSYKVGLSFPNGIQANVPLIRCVETDTTSGDTNCLDFPNANGAQGECGTPGCYDRAKIEVDHQNNPIDSLYLVSITDINTTVEYFLQSDHTVNTVFDINDYMTLCALQGSDSRVGSGCQNSGDPEWDEALQRTNIFGLTPGGSYDIKVRALNGDFTESPYSPTSSITLQFPVISFDIDIADSSGFSTETGGNHSISLGELTPGIVVTADDRIWLDMNSNIVPGFNVYVKDLNNGLLSGIPTSIPSQSEDLDVDSGNDGGFGLKVDTSTQTSLGPLIASGTYDTTGGNEVGSVSTTDAVIFSTNTTGSNLGQISDGRAALLVKALPSTGALPGIFTDVLTFTMIPNV